MLEQLPKWRSSDNEWILSCQFAMMKITTFVFYTLEWNIFWKILHIFMHTRKYGCLWQPIFLSFDVGGYSECYIFEMTFFWQQMDPLLPICNDKNYDICLLHIGLKSFLKEPVCVYVHLQIWLSLAASFLALLCYTIKIKYWNASGSGFPPSLIPALQKIGILHHKKVELRIILQQIYHFFSKVSDKRNHWRKKIRWMVETYKKGWIKRLEKSQLERKAILKGR